MIGRRNGRTADTSPAALDAELAEGETALRRIEKAGPLLDDLLGEARACLERCETFFRDHGFMTVGASASEQAFHSRQSMIGALMAIGRDELLAAEEARVRRRFEPSGSFGLSTAEKTARADELRRKRRQLSAVRELALRREEEGRDILAPPGGRDGEMFLLDQATLTAIAEGRAPACRAHGTPLAVAHVGQECDPGLDTLGI